MKRKSRKSAKAKLIALAPGAMSPGVDNAKKFFDEVDKNLGLQAMIGVNQGNIIAVAAGMGWTFDYDDMQDHLRTRWGVTKPPKGKYCCT